MAVTSDIPFAFSAQSFSGGQTLGVGRGDTWRIRITGQGATDDRLKLDFVDNGSNTVLAAGDVIGSAPLSAIALNNRVYYISGNTLYFSALGDPTQFETQGIGAGFIDMSNNFAQAEPLTGIASYQGKLAIFARNSAQIWQISPDPAGFAQIQVLPNTGTMASKSVKSIGDLDVIYLYDTGIRSLRVRDSSLNAVLVDVGTPIDTLVQDALSGATSYAKSTACAVVEPTGGRYWLYLDGTIYVLSYYPSAKIVAWSTYLPTYQSGSAQYEFVPAKFEVYNNQVYATDNVALFTYGGTSGTTYDNAVATVQVPFFDMKRPAHNKTAGGIDVDLSGSWNVACSPDWIDDNMITALQAQSTPTFDKGWIPFNATGTHFTFYAQTTGSTAAKISQLTLHYQTNDSPFE
jgi:hypothetical protein